MKKIFVVAVVSLFAIPSFGMKRLNGINRSGLLNNFFKLNGKTQMERDYILKFNGIKANIENDKDLKGLNRDGHIIGKKRKRDEEQLPKKKRKIIDLDIHPTIAVIKRSSSNGGSNIVQGEVESFFCRETYCAVDPSYYFHKILHKKDKDKTARDIYLEELARIKFGSLKDALCVGGPGPLRERVAKCQSQIGTLLKKAGIKTPFSEDRNHTVHADYYGNMVAMFKERYLTYFI